jgi:hypothetical protein
MWNGNNSTNILVHSIIAVRITYTRHSRQASADAKVK